MLDNQKVEFFKLMTATLEIYGQPQLSQDAVRIWWAALQKFEIGTVRQALDEHIRKSKFAPRPADILDILDKINPDGRPTAEEAWAMIPKGEQSSVVMTEEMAKALRIAQPLLDERDHIAARMAFKDAYSRLVDTAKRLGEPVKWFPSLGSDKEGREACLAEAVRLGRLPSNQAIGLLPPDKIAPMLEAAGKENLALEHKVLSNEELQKRIAQLREKFSKG